MSPAHQRPFFEALRVRIKELASEAQHIRLEEKKAKTRGDSYTVNELHEHRIRAVRPAARTAQIAYGFLRGRPYRTIEQNCKHPPCLRRLKRLVKDFGRGVDPDGVEPWLDAKG